MWFIKILVEIEIAEIHAEEKEEIEAHAEMTEDLVETEIEIEEEAEIVVAPEMTEETEEIEEIVVKRKKEEPKALMISLAFSSIWEHVIK